MNGSNCNTIKDSRFYVCMFFILVNFIIPIKTSGENLFDGKKSSWYWSRPTPTGNILYSVYFPDRKYGYAAGAFGTIIKTTDGGTTWIDLNSNSADDLSEIYFINRLDGFAAGSSGSILKTTNGGSNWVKVFTGTDVYLHDIIFPVQATGYCAGLSGTVLKSSDKGNSWRKIVSGTTAPLFCLDFIDDEKGIAGGYKIIIKTSDGGKSWDNQDLDYSKIESVAGVSYINDNTIYAAGNIPGGSFCKTTDGGVSWKISTLGLPYVFDGSVDLVRSMSFLNVNTGYIVTDFGTILKTSDSGNTWIRDSSFRPSYTKLSVMYDINIADSNCIFISGSGGTLISSENAGQNWYVKSGNKNTLRASHFTDQYFGIAAGERGEVLKTKDGGLKWTELNNFTTKFLNSVFFINYNTGYVAGDSGAIYKTTNAGNSWTDQTNYRRYNIKKIIFTNELSGIAAGGNPENERAFIYKTADGGLSWYEVYDSLSLGVLNSAEFMNETYGIAVGNNGNVLYSYDAGESWITDNISTFNLFSVSFQNDLDGLISGANGLIYKSTDGGNEWNPVVSGHYINLHSVKYISNNFAAAAGEKGTVLYSYNGGYNWFQEKKITYNDLFALEIFDNSKAAAFGEYGTIINSNINKSVSIQINNFSEIGKNNIMSQNYPNPFNPATVIRYKLYNDQFVNIKVYDARGNELKVLLNEFKPAGSYDVNFNGSDLSSGVYYYCLILNNKITESNRMVLLK